MEWKEKLEELKESFEETDRDMARELALFADNNEDLYRQKIQSFISNYARKMKRGEFNKQRAIEGLANNLFPEAKKKYIQETGIDLGRVDKGTKMLFGKIMLENIMVDYLEEEAEK